MSSPLHRSSHSSHKHNASQSTTASSAAAATPAVESAVTRLLVAIKQLLESLTYWSTGKMDHFQVSDVYVQLGNDFNSAVQAFGAYGISMDELMSIPQELRDVLEEALGEEASPQTLAQYLDSVRAIITKLLQGLRTKQNIYRRTVADKQERRSRGDSTASSSRHERHERQGSSGRYSTASSSRATSRTGGATSSASRQSSVTSVDPEQVPARYSQKSSSSRTSRPNRSETPASLPEEEEASNTLSILPSEPQPAESRPPSSGLIDLANTAALTEERLKAETPPPPASPPSRPALQSSKSVPAPRVPRDSDVDVRRGSSQSSSLRALKSPPPPLSDIPLPDTRSEDIPPPSPEAVLSPTSAVPANVKRYSLSDKPVPHPDIQIITPSPQLGDVAEKDESTSAPLNDDTYLEDNDATPTTSRTMPMPPEPPSAPPPSDLNSTLSTPSTSSIEREKSLAALKRSEALERRASKRFSTWTFSKMVGSPGGGGPGAPASPQLDRTLAQHNRKSVMLANAGMGMSMLSTGDLAAVAEDDDGTGASRSAVTTPVPSPSKSRRRAATEKDYGELGSRKRNTDARRSYRIVPGEEPDLGAIGEGSEGGLGAGEAVPPVPSLPEALRKSPSTTTLNANATSKVSPTLEPGSSAGEDETAPAPPPKSQTPSPRIAITPVPPSPTASTVQRLEPEPTPERDLGPEAEADLDHEPEVLVPSHVFLQVGRHVKKVRLDDISSTGLSFASLRVLFVDKFAYNPGSSDFPSIYIRDPRSGVQYELEDVSEVTDGCLLSLNIEPLDQIKQHIDSQMLALAQDIKDLKSSVVSARRQSLATPIQILPNPLPSTPDRPTEKQFQTIARRLTRVIKSDTAPSILSNATVTPSSSAASVLSNAPTTSTAPIPIPASVSAQPLVQQMTGGSIINDATATRMVSDLKTQFDEVQNLRRDLGVMRQVYIDFINSTKDSLGALRTQAQSVRELANHKVGGTRAYIDAGKVKLDTRSQDVLTKVDDLQDTVENLRNDVIKRHVSPKPNVMRALKADIASSAAELESLSTYIATIKPMWKQTWEAELNNIVEEQEFLKHQEEFVKDLLDDHRALTEVYEQVDKVVSLRGSGSKNGGSLRAVALRHVTPTPEESQEGLSTLMYEIRGAAIDPEKRMRAIEANQKARDKELASRSDEFQEELSGFVNGKRLKRTGGAEEAERLRQKRNDAALKAMFSPAAGTLTLGDFSTM